MKESCVHYLNYIARLTTVCAHPSSKRKFSLPRSAGVFGYFHQGVEKEEGEGEEAFGDLDFNNSFTSVVVVGFETRVGGEWFRSLWWTCSHDTVQQY